MTDDHDLIPEMALRWYSEGGSVLATVIRTWGSAPRPVGSQAAISSSGEIAGSVSGGCVEGAIIAEAGAVMASGNPEIFEFGVSDEDAFAVGLACGGQIRILVEPVGGSYGLPVGMLQELVEHRTSRRPVALLVNTGSWERQISTTGTDNPDLDARFRQDRSGFENDWFVNIFNPPLRLIVIGAVHVAQPLVTMARLCGYDVHLVDPRDTFATRERFPGVDVINDWPDEVIEDLGPDARTAVVTLTHDPKIDDAALVEIIDRDVFYIGSLGSRRTHAKRLERLRARGHDKDVLDRIHAPVGLDIGAMSPGEIAIAIMAEITSCLRKAGSD